jgi:hypothetical protein
VLAYLEDFHWFPMPRFRREPRRDSRFPLGSLKIIRLSGTHLTESK